MPFRYLILIFIGAAMTVAATYYAFRAGAATVGSATAEVTKRSAVTQQRGPTAAQKRNTKPGVHSVSVPPVPYEPLRQVFADLQTRTDAGDVNAATRLYRDLSLCSSARKTEWTIARMTDQALNAQAATMDGGQLQNYQNELDAVENNQRAVRNLQRLCDGADQAMLDHLVPDLKKAAELGDPEARACYLSRGPNYDPRTFIDHPEFLDAYRSNVPSMVEAGVAAGDWKVIDLLRDAYQPGADGFLAAVVGSDPVQYYRYLKLYRLGAEAYRVAALDQEISAAVAKLTPEQQSDADAWAQQTFQQNFRGSSTELTVSGWDPCLFSYEENNGS